MVEVAPWLIVGLGNPGSEYAKNRHNVGFMAVERLVERHDLYAAWRDKFKAKVASLRIGDQRCVVVKPQTYMNRSGQSVGPAATFHKVPVEQVVVVHDELDFPFGRVAIKRGGGHGGHNGLRDIIKHLPSPEFIRVRVGIGRPPRGQPGRDVSNWVLSDFSGDEAIALPDLVADAERAVSAILADGVARAMNDINSQPSPS